MSPSFPKTGTKIDNFSWRSVFYINIPLGILGTWMAYTFIQEHVEEIKGFKNFDIWGSVTLGISLGAMVLVLDQGQSWGWASGNSILSYFIIVVSFFAFLWIEQREKEPVIDLKFFKIPAFTAALVTSFISFMGLLGGLFLMPIFAQTFLGYSVTKAGYLFMPMSIGIVISAAVGARLSTKFPARNIVGIGMLVAAFIMYFMMSGIDIRWTFWDLTWRLTVFAFGLGLGLSPLTNAATSSVSLQEVGVASSILALVRNISGAFGVAIFATILSNSVTKHMIELQKFSVINATDPIIVQKAISLMTVKANVLAYTTVFHVSGLIIFVGAVSALFVSDIKKDQKTEHAIEV